MKTGVLSERNEAIRLSYTVLSDCLLLSILISDSNDSLLMKLVLSMYTFERLALRLSILSVGPGNSKSDSQSSSDEYFYFSAC